MSHRLVVVGVGGIGSWLVDGLARMLQFSSPGSGLLLVDGDTYEPKNMERQSFTAYGNKAEVKAAELSIDFNKIIIIPVSRYVVENVTAASEDEDEAEVFSTRIRPTDLFEDGDIVIVATDNHAARALCFKAATTYDNIDVLTGGNDDAYYGSIVHYQRRDGVDVTEHPTTFHPELENPPDRNPGEMSCAERAALAGSTQLLATNMAVAAHLLARTKQLLDGAEPVIAEVYFDLEAGVSSGIDRRCSQYVDADQVSV